MITRGEQSMRIPDALLGYRDEIYKLWLDYFKREMVLSIVNES